MSSRDGQTWMMSVGENGQILIFTVVDGEHHAHDLLGSCWLRAVLLHDTHNVYDPGAVVNVQDGPWERMAGTHVRVA